MVSKNRPDPCPHRVDSLIGMGVVGAGAGHTQVIIVRRMQVKLQLQMLQKGRQRCKPVKFGNTLTWGGASLSR